MKKEYQNIISEYLGVEPIFINSALVSGQMRKRLYWTNIPVKGLPKDKGITLADILEKNPPANFWVNRPLTDRMIKNVNIDLHKSKSLLASMYKGSQSNGMTLVRYYPGAIVGRRLNESGRREDYNKNLPITQVLEVRDNDKSNCLSTVQKDNVVTTLPPGRYTDMHFRRITPLECERLQTLPDNYTDMLSDTQRYKALGNGWTVDVIVFILGFMKL